jgi:hypothetical protein
MADIGNTLYITNCPIAGYNGTYSIVTRNDDHTEFTVTSANTLNATSVSGFDLSRTKIYSSAVDQLGETIMLWIYNVKPDQMLFNDPYAFPWLQDYAYSFAKRIVGEAREKFATIAGPQGGTQLNGAALKQEAQAEMEKLEEDLKTYVDGGTPLTWVTG